MRELLREAGGGVQAVAFLVVIATLAPPVASLSSSTRPSSEARDPVGPRSQARADGEPKADPPPATESNAPEVRPLGPALEAPDDPALDRPTSPPPPHRRGPRVAIGFDPPSDEKAPQFGTGGEDAPKAPEVADAGTDERPGQARPEPADEVARGGMPPGQPGRLRPPGLAFPDMPDGPFLPRPGRVGRFGMRPSPMDPWGPGFRFSPPPPPLPHDAGPNIGQAIEQLQRQLELGAALPGMVDDWPGRRPVPQPNRMRRPGPPRPARARAWSPDRFQVPPPPQPEDAPADRGADAFAGPLSVRGR